MKYLTYIIILISISSCNSKPTDNKKVNEQKPEPTKISESKDFELIIGERINGPANIRNKPNGDILFELHDNVLVDVTKEPENDWYQVLIYADIEYDEFGLDSISKNRPIVIDNDTVGSIMQTNAISTGQGRDLSYAMLYGYTHMSNIKPETVIETAFKKNLLQNGRSFATWKSFIKSFNLDTNAVGYSRFQTFYNYENTLDDPSPGFRIVLLFENRQLIGLIHSREIKMEKARTHKLDWNCFVTFFQEYPNEQQREFVIYMNEWIKGVD